MHILMKLWSKLNRYLAHPFFIPISFLFLPMKRYNLGKKKKKMHLAPSSPLNNL